MLSAPNKRSTVLWSSIAAVGLLVLAGALWWFRASARPALPELAAYPSLPGRFADQLALAHRAAVAPGTDDEAIRRLARLYQANRLAPEARACFAWLAARPGSLTAQDHYLSADLALDAGDLPAAQVSLRAVLQADPAYLPARIRLAESLFKSGEETTAATEYEAILAREADQPHALLGLARLDLQRGDDAAAITRLERVLAVHPATTSAAALLAQVMSRRGEPERAEALVEWSRRARDPLPADPWLDALWADCYDVQRLTLRFEELVYSGQMEAALPLLERVGELDPQSWLPHLLRGWTLARAQRWPEAVGEYRRALDKNGDPERVIPLLLPALLAQNRMAEAVAAVESALQLRPDSVPLLTFQADLAVRQGDEARTRALLTALLQKEPYLYTANMNLAKILWARNERAEAVSCLTRVAKAFPTDVAARGLLAQHYLETGDLAAALLPLEQALPQTEAGSPARERVSALLASALGRRAAEFAQARQFRPAADVLTRLAALQPGNPTVHISLGDMLYQAGDSAAARLHWEKALAGTAPGDAVLRAALRERLEGRITPELFN